MHSLEHLLFIRARGVNQGLLLLSQTLFFSYTHQLLHQASTVLPALTVLGLPLSMQALQMLGRAALVMDSLMT